MSGDKCFNFALFQCSSMLLPPSTCQAIPFMLWYGLHPVRAGSKSAGNVLSASYASKVHVDDVTAGYLHGSSVWTPRLWGHSNLWFATEAIQTRPEIGCSTSKIENRIRRNQWTFWVGGTDRTWEINTTVSGLTDQEIPSCGLGCSWCLA